MVKHLPAMRETWVQSLGQEDLLEKGTATHSSILAWKILWMEEPGEATVYGVAKSRHNWDAEDLVPWPSVFCVFFLFLFFSLKACEGNLPVAVDFLKVGCVWNLFLQYCPWAVPEGICH